MKPKKVNVFIIVVLFASLFSLFGVKNTTSMIIQIILLTIGLLIIIVDAVKSVKGLQKTTKKELPGFIKNAKDPKGRISSLIMGMFIVCIGALNFKLKVLGSSSASGPLTNSFQYTFAIVLIMLGSALIFLALTKMSKKILLFTTKHYEAIGKILYYFFIILSVFILISMISPFIWP